MNALRVQLTLDDHLRGDAGVIRARLPQRVLRRSSKEFKADNTLDFNALKLGEKRTQCGSRKAMTCSSTSAPARNGHLGRRSAPASPVRLTQPKENCAACSTTATTTTTSKADIPQLAAGQRGSRRLRRPPAGHRVLQLNGEWLTPGTAAPRCGLPRPKHYGYKCVKWLTHIVLSNLYHANDTYGDTKQRRRQPDEATFAATLHVPNNAKANTPLPVTGVRAVGHRGAVARGG